MRVLIRILLLILIALGIVGTFHYCSKPKATAQVTEAAQNTSLASTPVVLPNQTNATNMQTPLATNNTQFAIIPTPPKLDAKAYVLMDEATGQVIAAEDPNSKLPPASLTKIMTLYIVSKALASGQIHLEDDVHVSEKAWRMEGSRMFIKEGTQVKVADLLKGIIIDSGNDACVALAEYVAGSEGAFAELMNAEAQALGMKNSHFTDSTGLPHPEHYTTPYDMAILARALIRDFPQFYPMYKEKWFTYNGIKQMNRNRLLWRNDAVDGIKTGHTDTAGFCLVASAKEGDTRLISVVMNTPSDQARANTSEQLLNYGFRFYETVKVVDAQKVLFSPRVWFGETKTVGLGFQQDLYLTLPKGTYDKVKAFAKYSPTLQAPIQKGASYGTLEVKLNDKILASLPLLALEDDPRAGFFSRLKDRTTLALSHLFSGAAQAPAG